MPPSWRLIRRNFRNLVVSTPVIGQKTGLGPWVNPSVSASSDMSYDAIEEVLRLAVSMDSISIHFSNQQGAFRRRIVILVGMADCVEVVGMQLSPRCMQCMVQRMPVRQRHVLDRENWGLMSGINGMGWSWSGVDRVVWWILVSMGSGCGPCWWGWMGQIWCSGMSGLILRIIAGIGQGSSLATMRIGRHGWCGETSCNRVTFSHVTAGAEKFKIETRIMTIHRQWTQEELQGKITS